jgi:hypothetical protein
MPPPLHRLTPRCVADADEHLIIPILWQWMLGCLEREMAAQCAYTHTGIHATDLYDHLSDVEMQTRSTALFHMSEIEGRL